MSHVTIRVVHCMYYKTHRIVNLVYTYLLYHYSAFNCSFVQVKQKSSETTDLTPDEYTFVLEFLENLNAYECIGLLSSAQLPNRVIVWRLTSLLF